MDVLVYDREYGRFNLLGTVYRIVIGQSAHELTALSVYRTIEGLLFNQADFAHIGLDEVGEAIDALIQARLIPYYNVSYFEYTRDAEV